MREPRRNIAQIVSGNTNDSIDAKTPQIINGNAVEVKQAKLTLTATGIQSGQDVGFEVTMTTTDPDHTQPIDAYARQTTQGRSGYDPSQAGGTWYWRVYYTMPTDATLTDIFTINYLGTATFTIRRLD